MPATPKPAASPKSATPKPAASPKRTPKLDFDNSGGYWDAPASGKRRAASPARTAPATKPKPAAKSKAVAKKVTPRFKFVAIAACMIGGIIAAVGTYMYKF